MKTALFSRKQVGGVYSIYDETQTTGNHWWVDSGSSNGADVIGGGQNPDAPFLTMGYAISSDQAQANNGDIIHVMPGHAETYSGEADLTMDIAGIRIVGQGRGGSKPTISVDTEHTEAAPVLISADNCSIENIRFVGINAGGSKTAIEITGDDAAIKGCEFIETTTDKELGIGAGYGIITLLDSDGAIARASILDCICYGLGGNDESFLSVTDGSNGATDVVIDGCRIIGTFADDAIQADAGSDVNTPWTITNSMIVNLGGNNVALTIDTGAVFFLDELAVFGAGGTTAPIVGYNASYMGRVWTCEPGAFGATGLIGSTTNWGA